MTPRPVGPAQGPLEQGFAASVARALNDANLHLGRLDVSTIFCLGDISCANLKVRGSIVDFGQIVPRGTLGFAEVTANQGGIVAAVDLTGLAVTVPVGAGRRLRISAEVAMSSTVANDVAGVTINLISPATTLQTCFETMVLAGVTTTMLLQAIYSPGPAGQYGFKLTASRVAGTGTFTMGASATIPAFILVEDIGT